MRTKGRPGNSPPARSPCLPRRLWLALTASAVFHAGLLLGVDRVLPVRFAAAKAPIRALITVRARVGQAPPPARLGAAVPAEARPQAPAPRPGRVAPVHRVDAPAERVAKAASGAVPAGGEAAPREGVRPDDLRRYRMALAIAARRFRIYPAMAREHGWEGSVEVALSVGAWRPHPEFSLVRSSGHAVLDQQALSMIEQAAAATTLPEGLQGKDFRLLLPIQFALDPER